MNRYFENFIRFFKPDSQTDDEKNRLQNYFEPREPMTGDLIAKKGDTWRFLVPKSDFGTTEIQKQASNSTNLQVGLYGRKYDENGVYTGDGIIIENIGFIRRQQSELYYEMIIKVNNSPDGETWKQFSLNRPNGKSLFGTFKSQTTDFEEYVDELTLFIESYPHTRVDVIRDGNLLKLRAWEDGNFTIRNEEIKVSIGEVDVLNVNTPQLSGALKETYERDAFWTYDLVIGPDVTEGNIFKLGSTEYTATKSDTAATIKAALLGSNTKVKINDSETIPINVSLGKVKTTNTNTPIITKLFESAAGGQDKYTISVDNFQKGNIFQVLSSSESPITVIVGESDTKASIEALLNPDAGFYSTNTGSVVTVNAVPAYREDNNTNNPQIFTENGVFTAAQEVDKYEILVGTSVKENNRFILNDKIITATAEDTYLSIITKLDLIEGQYYEVEAGTDFEIYAEKGPFYNDSNIADVQLISSPIRRVSNQYLCEVTFPDGYDYNGKYQISVSKYVFSSETNTDEFAGVIGLSNFFRVEDNPTETMMLRFSDIGENYGFEYFEEGLSQQIRVPIFLKNERPETTIVQRQSVNDATIKGNTTIRKIYDFVVDGYCSWFHRALNIALSCDNVFLENKKVSLISYTPTEDKGRKKVQSASGSLYEQNYSMKNFGKLWLDSDNYLEKATILADFQDKTFALVVFNDYIRRDITEQGEIYIPVGEYYWKCFVGGAAGESITMRIYQNGQIIHDVVLLCGRWNMLKTLIRVYHSDTLTFQEVATSTTIQDLETSLQISKNYSEVTYQNEKGTISDKNGKVTPFTPPENITEGQWRIHEDEENGTLDFEKLADGNWITKHSLE